MIIRRYPFSNDSQATVEESWMDPEDMKKIEGQTGSDDDAGEGEGEGMEE